MGRLRRSRPDRAEGRGARHARGLRERHARDGPGRDTHAAGRAAGGLRRAGGRGAEGRVTNMVETQYAVADDGTNIAYRVLDADPSCTDARDVVLIAGGFIPLEIYEEEPGFARLLDGLRSLGRLAVLDRRGVGLSDPIVDWERPVLDQWCDDVATVVQAAGFADVVVVS